MSAQTATRLDADEKSTVAIATVSAAHFRKLGQGSVSSARLDDDEKGAYIVRTLGDLTERRPSVPGLFNCPTVGQMKFAPPWRKVVEAAGATEVRSRNLGNGYGTDTSCRYPDTFTPKTSSGGIILTQRAAHVSGWLSVEQRSKA